MINFASRKKKGKKKRIVIVVIFLFIAVWVYYAYSISTKNSSDAEIVEFIIEPGQGSTKISHQLKDAGLIRSPLIFQFYVWQQGISSKLKSGEYFLAQNLTLTETAKTLFRGPGATKEKTLTFIEGWTLDDLAQYLENQGIARSTDFFNVVQKKASWWNQYDFLDSKPKNLDLEGYLFPDTYRVYTDVLVEDVVKKMLNNFEAKLTPELKAEIKKQGKTIHEILTLASILEKEVSTDTDRKKVADIFYKRLDAGIAFQADSTVNYATGKSVARASSKDLSVDSPYNTYKYRGFPPGPICNPGISSIVAAIYPIPNPYWFFLTTPAGEVIYSKTFEEHVTAKQKYY